MNRIALALAVVFALGLAWGGVCMLLVWITPVIVRLLQ